MKVFMPAPAQVPSATLWRQAVATRQRRDTFAPLKPEKLKPRIAQARAHFESKFAKVVSLRNLFSGSQLNSSPFIRTVVAAAAAASNGNGTSSDASSSLTPVVKLHITAAGQTATLRLVVDPIDGEIATDTPGSMASAERI